MADILADAEFLFDWGRNARENGLVPWFLGLGDGLCKSGWAKGASDFGGDFSEVAGAKFVTNGVFVTAWVIDEFNDGLTRNSVLVGGADGGVSQDNWGESGGGTRNFRNSFKGIFIHIIESVGAGVIVNVISKTAVIAGCAGNVVVEVYHTISFSPTFQKHVARGGSGLNKAFANAGVESGGLDILHNLKNLGHITGFKERIEGGAGTSAGASAGTISRSPKFGLAGGFVQIAELVERKFVFLRIAGGFGARPGDLFVDRSNTNLLLGVSHETFVVSDGLKRISLHNRSADIDFRLLTESSIFCHLFLIRIIRADCTFIDLGSLTNCFVRGGLISVFSRHLSREIINFGLFINFSI